MGQQRMHQGKQLSPYATKDQQRKQTMGQQRDEQRSPYATGDSSMGQQWKQQGEQRSPYATGDSTMGQQWKQQGEQLSPYATKDKQRKQQSKQRSPYWRLTLPDQKQAPNSKHRGPAEEASATSAAASSTDKYCE